MPIPDGWLNIKLGRAYKESFLSLHPPEITVGDASQLSIAGKASSATASALPLDQAGAEVSTQVAAAAPGLTGHQHL